MKYAFIIVFSGLLAFSAMAQEQNLFLSIYDKYWEVDEDYYRVMLSDKIGLIDKEGNVIIPCENEQVWNLQDNGNIKVLKKGKIGLYNVSGQLVISPVYDMIWDFSEGRARVMKDGKIGCVNAAGFEFIPCIYDQIWNFSEGKAKVLKDGKIGYINEAGEEIIPVQYQNIWDFNEDKAKVLKNGKIGYINHLGVEIIPCVYQHISDFEDGVARVIKNGEIFYIDEKGVRVNQQLMKSNTSSSQDSMYVQRPSNPIDKDTTSIKFLGSEMKIVSEDQSKKFSFYSDKHDQYKERKPVKKSFEGHYWGVDLGFNSYLTSSGELSLPAEYDYLSLNSGKSVEVTVNALQQNVSLNRKGNIGFVTGLGLNYNNYRFENNIVLAKDDMGNLSYEFIDGNVDKTKLTTLYLTAPLLFELQLSKQKKDEFYISAGGIVGYRLSSHTKVVTEEDGKKDKDKNQGSFTLNDFKYGVQARIGYRSINIYGSYYLSPLFDTNKGLELHPISIGFCFYPDWW
jgi:hypothetical protein